MVEVIVDRTMLVPVVVKVWLPEVTVVSSEQVVT